MQRRETFVLRLSVSDDAALPDASSPPGGKSLSLTLRSVKSGEERRFNDIEGLSQFLQSQQVDSNPPLATGDPPPEQTLPEATG
ncbi:MAG: hypothetical protein IAF08_06310 [Rhizobacter sp.]|nr:hypothetical protein [Chlorobiales bacterium]